MEEQKPLLDSGPADAGSEFLSQEAPVVTESPQSASQYYPVQNKDFETSTVHLETIPIATIDKKCKDLVKLYNEVIDNFRSLETETHKFKEYLVVDYAGTLETCVALLRKRAAFTSGDVIFRIERHSKFFIELSYDDKEIKRTCEVDPETVIRPLDHFSNACRHIRDVLEHAPTVERDVKIILQDEDTIKQEIMKADLPQTEIQQSIKTFYDNISKLRVVAAANDKIKRVVESKFKEFMRAASGFFNES